MGDPGGGFVDGGRRRRQGVRADLAVEARRVHPPTRHLRGHPRLEMNHLIDIARARHDCPMTALPRGSTVRRDAGLYGYERACAGPGCRRSPASTRPAGAPVPGRWSRPRRSCPRARPAWCPGSPTPSCSPRRPASAATTRSCAARWPGRWWSSSRGSATGSACTSPTSRRCAARWPGWTCRPAYVLTDGFPVDGLGVPGLAVWKGDRVAACISAASVLAKVTRDRIMCELHEQYPAYDFDLHKGYSPPSTRTRWPSTGRARSTGCGSSTCGVPRDHRPGTHQSGAPAGAVGPTEPAHRAAGGSR